MLLHEFKVAARHIGVQPEATLRAEMEKLTRAT